MQKTANYQLNQWEAADKLSRADFNADNAAIDAALANKAEKSAVTAVETALANYKTSNDAAVANKANAAEVSALSQSVSALSTALGGKGNCRIAMGSYVGTGTYGINNPSNLSFDFCPQFIWFTSTVVGNQYFNGFFMRPYTQAKALDGSVIGVTWMDKGVSWYSGMDTAVGQNNSANITYSWIAIGEA